MTTKDVKKWLRENVYSKDRQLCRTAAEEGRLDVLKGQRNINVLGMNGPVNLLQKEDILRYYNGFESRDALGMFILVLKQQKVVISKC